MVYLGGTQVESTEEALPSQPSGRPSTSTGGARSATELARRLRLHRAAERLSQERLGKALGTTGATVRRWESGQTPQRRFWSSISTRLGVPEHLIAELATSRVIGLADTASESEAGQGHNARREPGNDVRGRTVLAVVELLENDKTGTAKEIALRLLRELDSKPIEWK